MKLKAYIVFPGRDPADEGCLLVFAPTRGKAKNFAWGYGFWDSDYVDYNAWRRQSWDKWAVKDEMHCMETNEDLPDGAPKFYDDED